MKSLIAIPCQDKVDTAFVNSLLKAKTDGSEILFAANSLVYAARDELAKKALDFDVLVFIDSDMVIPETAIERALARVNELGVVTGLCFRRREPYLPALWQILNPSDMSKTRIYEEYPEDKIFKVAACGMAFCAIRTDILKRTFERFNTCFYPVEGLGEDVSFCARLGELGVGIWCDPSLKIGHLTQTVIDERIYKAYKKGSAANA